MTNFFNFNVAYFGVLTSKYALFITVHLQVRTSTNKYVQGLTRRLFFERAKFGALLQMQSYMNRVLFGVDDLITYL